MSVAEVTGIVSLIVVGIGGLIATIVRDRSSRKEARVKAREEAAASLPRLSVAVRVSSRSKSNDGESDDEFLNRQSARGEPPYIIANSASSRINPMTFRLQGTVPTPPGENLVHSGYLDILAQSGPLPPVPSSDASPFKWSFPYLDFKINNPGTVSVLITDVELSDITSRPLLFPLPSFCQGHFGLPRRIVLNNDGWGPMRDVRLSFNVVNSNFVAGDSIADDSRMARSGSQDGPSLDELMEPPYRFSRHLGDITERESIDISPELKDLGVDLDLLDSQLQWIFDKDGNVSNYLLTRHLATPWTKGGQKEMDAITSPGYLLATPDGEQVPIERSAWDSKRAALCAPVSSGVALVAGRLDYTGEPVHRSSTPPHSALVPQSIRFWTHAPLFGAGQWGGGVYSSYKARVWLEPDRVGYSRVIDDIAFSVEKNTSDRFELELGADKSSWHNFSVRLRGANGFELDIGTVTVLMIVPRTDADFLSPNMEPDAR